MILHQQALHTILNFVNQAIESFSKALDGSDSKEVSSVFVVKKDERNKLSKLTLLFYELCGFHLSPLPNFQIRVTFYSCFTAPVPKAEAKKKVPAKKHVDSKDVLLSFHAHLDRLTVQLSTQDKNLIRLVLGKLNLSFEQRPKKSTMSMELTEFQLLNLDPKGFYTTVGPLWHNLRLNFRNSIMNSCFTFRSFLKNMTK